MARPLTNDELTLLRSDMQGTKLYLAIYQPNTIYTALVSAVPASNDQVYEISFDNGTGTLGDVKAGMTLYVGTSAGGHELGICRIRKAPIAGTFYIGLISEIVWADNAYLTVVDDFDLWAKHAVLSSGNLLMDVDVDYSDQHATFSPVPVLGPHAIAWLDEVTVDVEFDASDSWVVDSSITGYSWSAPGSSASSGMSTAAPTITYNAAGCYRVLCTVTAANGKTTTGVRHVFVYDRTNNQPFTVFQLAQCMGDYDTGGWMFDMTMQAEAALTDIHDRALVVLFAEDWYGTTKQSIGPVANRENIVCVGRIAGESIRWDRENGLVHFTVHGFQHWLNKIKSFPVELTFVGAAGDWDEMPDLNIDRALWHVLYWHSTAVETMDFYRTEDTRFIPQARTIASMIWGQLVDLAFSKIFAFPGVDRLGRLFVEIDPQMVPEASRDFPVVMDITSIDFNESVDFSRRIVNDVSLISLNAEEVNSAGSSVTRYSLSPGHVPLRHGEPEMMERVLCSSQANANTLAGLVLGWRTNPYPDIPINFAMNNRMIDLFPRQNCTFEVTADDTPREVAFDINLIPRRAVLYFDADSGWMHNEINFEGETFEQVNSDGDIPDVDSDDISFPPLPPLPPLPDLPPILPGETTTTEEGPPRVLLHDPSVGLLYSENFNTASPTWRTVNAGLTATQYQNINRIVICPNGAIYVGKCGGGESTPEIRFIARAPYVGGTFEIVEDQDSIQEKFGLTGSNYGFVLNFECNPLASEYVVYGLNDLSTIKMYRGYFGNFTEGVNFSSGAPDGHISYGLGKWVVTGNSFSAKMWILDSTAGSLLDTKLYPTDLGFNEWGHVRVSSTGTIYHYINGDDRISISTDNGGGFTHDIGDDYVGSPNTADAKNVMALDPTGQYMMTHRATTGKGKSSDNGATLVDIANLPFVGTLWRFAYAGGVGGASRWIAASSYVYYSDDFGVSTWSDKRGNILSLAPLLQANIVKVVQF